MSTLSLCINMDKSWNTILPGGKIVKTSHWYGSCMDIIKHIELYIIYRYIHMYVEAKKMHQWDTPSTLGWRWWAERMTVLILLKIGSEVTMAKCWYLLNSSGGCISVYIMLFFSTFMLYTLRYFEIKNFNLTVPLTVVWLEVVYGDIFLVSKTK